MEVKAVTRWTGLKFPKLVGIVVATELAARGLDALLVLTHVINLDLPTDGALLALQQYSCRNSSDLALLSMAAAICSLPVVGWQVA